MPSTRPRIISFSGIDGGGKSTQISALESYLRDSGLRTTTLTFWDDVVVGGRFREMMSHKAFRGEKGIGTPERPINRRDKNVSSRLMTALRCALYFADGLNLRLVVSRLKRTQADVVIFDRYIYDEVANLPLNNRLAAAFVRLLLRCVPKPDLALLIDADPPAARARKPEYPLDFLHRNRQAYLALSEMSGHITVIAPLSIDAAHARIRSLLPESLARHVSGLSALPA